MGRRRVASGTPWERCVGYSRAVRAGNLVAVSGTTGTDEGGQLVPGGAYEQALRALDNILRALRKLGAGPSDVTRTRIFVRDIADWKEVGRAHSERFGRVRPASSMVEVAGFVEPEMLVEIEADAIVGRRSAPPRRRARRERKRARVPASVSGTRPHR